MVDQFRMGTYLAQSGQLRPLNVSRRRRLWVGPSPSRQPRSARSGRSPPLLNLRCSRHSNSILRSLLPENVSQEDPLVMLFAITYSDGVM